MYAERMVELFLVDVVMFYKANFRNRLWLTQLAVWQVVRKSKYPAVLLLVFFSIDFAFGAGTENTSSKEIIEINASHSLTEKNLLARVVPKETIEIIARLDGVVDARTFFGGEFVKQGQSLFQIDTSWYGLDFQRKSALVSAAESKYHFIKGRYDRAKKLAKSQLLSIESLEELAAEEKKILAELNVAISDRDMARLKLDYAKVVAPISGRVGFSDVEAGDYVREGQSALARIYVVDTVYLEFEVPLELQQERGAPKVGDTNERRKYTLLVAGKAITLTRENIIFSPVASENNGRQFGRIEWDNRTTNLLPGDIAYVALSYQQKEIVVPEQYVRTILNDSFVSMVGVNGKVISKKITIGQKTKNGLVVTGGLHPGDKIQLLVNKS